MTLNSMTGFARFDGAFESQTWHWEMKSVNGKALDLRFRLPHGFDDLEAELRTLGAKHFSRGNIQINLHLSGGQSKFRLAINEELLGQLLEIAGTLQARTKSAPVTVEGLLSQRGVLEQVEITEDDETRQARTRALAASAGAAFAALAAMRADEGKRLSKIVHGQIDTIAGLSEQARDCPARSPEAIRTRFGEQIARLMETEDRFDADRLHQEAMLIAAKADVQEELDRLFAHVEAARQLLAGPGPVGRKLDFLTQEFNREANTLCSKAADKTLSRIGLELKAVIDQLREQVQNIE